MRCRCRPAILAGAHAGAACAAAAAAAAQDGKLTLKEFEKLYRSIAGFDAAAASASRRTRTCLLARG